MNRYFYIDKEGQQKGVFSPEELKNEGIKKETLVWKQGMSEWVHASKVDELSFIFDETIGTPPSTPEQQFNTSSAYAQSTLKSFDEINVAPIMRMKDWLLVYLIMIIPLVNIVFLFIWAFSDSPSNNPNRASWAKASLIWMGIILVLYLLFFMVIISAIGGLGNLGDAAFY